VSVGPRWGYLAIHSSSLSFALELTFAQPSTPPAFTM
jgi:hypothetical protein